jgi:hypothetical protein
MPSSKCDTNIVTFQISLLTQGEPNEALSCVIRDGTLPLYAEVVYMHPVCSCPDKCC